MTTTTKIAGEAMTDEWRTAFDDRHEFDVYPEHFMSGLRNEFAAGWHAAMKSQAHALLASKQAIGCAVDGDEIGAIRKASELMCAMGYTADASQITCFLARVARAYPTAPAQLCGEDAAEQADEAVMTDARRWRWIMAHPDYAGFFGTPEIKAIDAAIAIAAEKAAGQEPVGEVTATVLEGADQGVIGWYGDPLPVNSLLYAAPIPLAKDGQENQS